MNPPNFHDSKVVDGTHGRTDVQLEHSDLRCWQGHAAPMPRAHRHDDLEVNLVSTAPLKYLFGGTPIEVKPGQLNIFWAAMPHRLIECPENWDSYVCWIHLPLEIVLNWGLPEPDVSQILRGTPLICTPADRDRPSKADFAQWAGDLASGSSELRTIALLEIQALVRRQLYLDASADEHIHEWSEPDDAMRHAAAMARYAATHFREPITAADVAASVYLHPNYAMTLFRRVVGTTLGTYLTQCRIAEAQRLLITTQATTSDIALNAGFGSQSGFYATFTRICQQSPGTYRRERRQGTSTTSTSMSA